MTKIGIIMPVRNCLALTQAAIASIQTQYPYEIYVIDDHSDQPMKDWLQSQTGDNFHYEIDPPTSGVAANWNLGIKLASKDGCTHFLIVNNDVLFHPQTIDKLVERMEQGDVVMATGGNYASNFAKPEDIFTYPIDFPATENEHPDFSCMMISPRTIDQIGWFDENFIGAYYEDNDYHARIALAGQKAVNVGHAPYYHYASQTLVQNPNLTGQIGDRQRHNHGYFQQKWGRSPVGDVPDMPQMYFKTPFNNPAKTIKDW